MHYYFLGDLNAQKTVVFLHGWGTDSSIFRWVLSFLPVNGIRYLLIDFWGFGKSIEKEKLFVDINEVEPLYLRKSQAEIQFEERNKKQ